MWPFYFSIFQSYLFPAGTVNAMEPKSKWARDDIPRDGVFESFPLEICTAVHLTLFSHS